MSAGTFWLEIKERQKLQLAHKKRREFIAKMDKIYRDDRWVSEALTKVMTPHNIASSLYWPTGRRDDLTAVSPYDAAHLNLVMKDPNKNLIIIPENNGSHWWLTCLYRNQNGHWGSSQVITRTDGTCGESTVEEAEKLVELSHNRNLLAPYIEEQRVTKQAIPKLPTMEEETKLPGVTTFDATQEEAQQASLKDINPIDLLLSELGHVELHASELGHVELHGADMKAMEHYQEKVIAEFRKLENPDDWQEALARLESIGHKESIKEIINKVKQETTSPSSNAHI